MAKRSVIEVCTVHIHSRLFTRGGTVSVGVVGSCFSWNIELLARDGPGCVASYCLERASHGRLLGASCSKPKLLSAGLLEVSGSGLSEGGAEKYPAASMQTQTPHFY